MIDILQMARTYEGNLKSIEVYSRSYKKLMFKGPISEFEMNEKNFIGISVIGWIVSEHTLYITID